MYQITHTYLYQDDDNASHVTSDTTTADSWEAITLTIDSLLRLTTAAASFTTVAITVNLTQDVSA